MVKVTGRETIPVTKMKIETFPATFYFEACANGNNGNGWCESHFLRSNLM